MVLFGTYKKLFQGLTLQASTITTAAGGRGRRSHSWVNTPNPQQGSGGLFNLVLAEPGDQEQMRWEQLQHPVRYSLVLQGVCAAKPGDRWVVGVPGSATARYMYIHSVKVYGTVQSWTVYTCEQRPDTA